MEEDILITEKNVEVTYNSEPDPLKTDVEQFYFKEKLKKITFKPYKNLDDIEKQLILDVQGNKTDQTSDELYNYFFDEPNKTPPIKMGFFKQLYKSYNNILKINGQDPITSFEEFYSNVLKKGSEIYLNDKSKQSLIEKEISDFNSKNIFNNILQDIETTITSIENQKPPVLQDKPKKPSDFPPKISNYKDKLNIIQDVDQYAIKYSYTNRSVTLIDADPIEAIYDKEGDDPDTYTDKLYNIIDNWVIYTLNNGAYDTDRKNYESLKKSFLESTKEDFYEINKTSYGYKEYGSSFSDKYNDNVIKNGNVAYQKTLFDIYYNHKFESFKKMTTEFNFAYSGLDDTGAPAKKCIDLGYRYFVHRPILGGYAGSADTNHCRMYDAYLNKVMKPLENIKKEFEDLITNPTGSYQTFKKEVLAYNDILDTYYKQSLPTYNKFLKLKGELESFRDLLKSLTPLKFFEVVIEEVQIKAGYYIPTPNLEIKLVENLKINTYKQKDTKILFNFTKPELISFKKSDKATKNEIGIGNYVPTNEQKLLNDYQPTKIIIHRIDKEVENIEAISAQNKFYKELNYKNTGFMFYENLEPNKDYYYFYYAFSTNYDSVTNQAPKPISPVLNNFVNGMYTLSNKNIKTLSDKLFNSFYIICSNVIKVRLVKDDNFYYLETKYITNDELNKKEYGKQFKEKFLIQPTNEIFELNDPKFDNNKPYLKVRLKSKKTNKKIDFNIQYILKKDAKIIDQYKSDYKLLGMDYVSGKLKTLVDKFFKFKNKGNSLLPGQKLQLGEYLRSQNGKYIFVLQEGDGNVVLYDIDNTSADPSWKSIWSTQTKFSSILNPFLALQDDGNLVYYMIYDNKLYAEWASTTAKNQINTQVVKLLLKDDGKLVLIDDNNNEVWSNGVYNKT